MHTSIWFIAVLLGFKQGTSTNTDSESDWFYMHHHSQCKNDKETKETALVSDYRFAATE